MSMTLRQIINALELIARRGEDKPVYFDFCRAFPLLEVGSSRCYYERPAINWDVRRRGDREAENPQAPKLSEFLKLMQDTVGKDVQGYKGGDYIVRESSTVHVDGYGECTSTVIEDVEDSVYEVRLITRTED